MAASPTSRSLALLRDRGEIPWVVERWSVRASGGKRLGRTLFHLENRVDLYNFGDILSFHPGELGCTVVQTTSYSNVPARKRKILESEAARQWVQDPNRKILIHGWHKPKNLWKVREVVLSAKDFRPLDPEVIK